MSAVIELSGVTKRYGKEEALSNISLSINQGEMVAIVGKSGRGKTTLLNIMGLITKHSAGDILLWSQKNPSLHSKTTMLLRREKIGYLFQNYGLVEEESVQWNLNLALEYKKLNKKQRGEKISALLEEFNLSHLKDKKVYQLSGGEQQRIAIIRLILQESDLILADEPTASLDVENEKVIMDYLKRLNDQGKTIVVVTHNQDILSYFTRVIDLSKT
ncbi:putative bacteriocin export ABC transporter [Jeotgalibacillus aurantiacus]|uniref:putative bacteriocin export ABC transporter n=1 Tax=Jeotgalibacillus aurantiacus TaxID=2763266 RepID=UPI001D0B1D25|nr:putative bacteriocin export ABC transporter [Jeotgalibacillus aurantiacus]